MIRHKLALWFHSRKTFGPFAKISEVELQKTQKQFTWRCSQKNASKLYYIKG